jgi:hypothetical protein
MRTTWTRTTTAQAASSKRGLVERIMKTHVLFGEVAFLVRAIWVLLAKVLSVGDYFAVGIQDPIRLRPNTKLDEDGITMAILCGEGHTAQGKGSKVLKEMSLSEVLIERRGRR